MSISFSGLASGLDTSSWVTSLTQLRQAKVTTLEEKKASIVSAQNALSGIRSFFNNFRATVEKITDSKFNVSTSNIFSKKVATSSNMMALTASVKSNAAEGSYNVKINQVATQTQVKSGYRYQTQLVNTTQATTLSHLKDIGIGYGTNITTGIKSGNIEITHNGVTNTIAIDQNETMNSFLEKIRAKGITADFDNDTGIFSIDVNVGDITDVDNTGILSKLKIQDINYGYTGEQLSIVDEHEEYHQADNNTLLSDLGVHLGTFTVRTATETCEITLDNDEETIGSLVNAMRESGIDATFSEGIFALNNAEITDSGETDIINALGLTSEVTSQTQTSDGLKYQTVWTTTTTALGDTLLKDVNGVVLEEEQTINIKNSIGDLTTITVDATTTIDSLVELMEDAGLTVDYTNGRLNISNGWIVEGGTFDVESAFGLTYASSAVTVTGDALTVTSTTISGATGDTKLGSLTTAVTSGNIDVTDTSNHVHHITVNKNSTINEFLGQIRALGLGANFDSTTGVLSLVGGEYTAVSYNGIGASNILNVFFGTDTLDPSTIDSASSISGVLKETIVHTHNAQGTTTLGELGMNDGTFTATFVRSGTIDNGDIVTINISDSMKLNELKSALITNGINADFDEASGKFYISESEFVGVSGGNFDDIMNFTSTTIGTYVNSVDIQSQTVTTGREMTSAGVVNKTVEISETTTLTETNTIAQESSSNPVTYDIVNYTPSSLITVGQTVTSSEPLTYTYTYINPTTQIMDIYGEYYTTGISSTSPVGVYSTDIIGQTGDTLYSNISHTVSVQQTSGVLSYTTFTRTATVESGEVVASTKHGLHMDVCMYREVTTPMTQTGHTMEYWIDSGGGYVYLGSYTGTTQLGDIRSGIGNNNIMLSNGSVLSFTAANTINDIVTSLCANGITTRIDFSHVMYGVGCTSATIYVGDQRDTNYITHMDPELCEILGLYEDMFYGVYTEPARGNTTLGSLGLTSNATIVIGDYSIELGNIGAFVGNPKGGVGGGSSSGGSSSSITNFSYHTITITTSDTINTFVDKIDDYWDLSFYDEGNGTLQLYMETGNIHVYYMDSISSNLESVLGITAGEGSTYQTTQHAVNLQNDILKGYGYSYGDLTATLIKGDGSTTVVTLDTTGTLASEISKIGALVGSADGHLHSSPTVSGASTYTFTQNSASGWAIESLSPELQELLGGMQVGEGLSYNTNGIEQATNDTRLSLLGLNSNGTIVTGDGNTITINPNDKISDVVHALRNNGIYATFNGSMTVGGNTDGFSGYIKNMTFNLAAALGLNTGEGNTYEQSYLADSNTTMAQLGLTESGLIVINGANGRITVQINTTDTIDNITQHYFHDIDNPLHWDAENARFYTDRSDTAIIESISPNLASVMGLQAGEGISYNKTFVHPYDFAAQSLFYFGLTPGTYNIVCCKENGNEYGDGGFTFDESNFETITIDARDTINDITRKFAESNIGYLDYWDDGTFILSYDASSMITYIDPELADILHLEVGEGINYEYATKKRAVNNDTTLEQLGMTGNSAVITTDSGTVTINKNQSIQNINYALGDNYSLTIDESGCISLGAAEGHYVKSMSSNISNALGLEVGYGSSYSVNIQEGSYTTTTNTATNDTTLAQLGLNYNTYIETDEGVFYIGNTNSMDDLVDLISDHNIFASYDEDTGVFTIGSDADEHYVVNMSPELASILGNINVGNHFTYHITENETEEEHSTTTYQTITGSDTFGTLGVTGTNYITLGDGDRVTITSSTTFGEFVENMNGKGFNVSLVNGIFNIQSNGNYIESDDNHILNKLNILGSTYTTTENTLGETKLKDLKDSEGNSLNISSGTINVIKNGISSTISINNNSKLDELANLLSNYNIQMDYGSGNSGHITFTGTGDSYLQERSASGATNLLTKLGVTDWSKIKNSESEKLEYTTNDNETIKLSTKLVNLKDSNGNSMGVTEGKYRIVAEGIHYEGTVSSDTTVEDFFADLSAYGITGTIRSNGQIILNTSNDNTYLETGNGEAGYSSIVDNVFADWSFGNIYIANPVDVTTVEISNMTSETHLKDIDQGTFKAGKFVVASNLDGTTISHDEDIILALDENATVGDFMSAISYYGFNSYVENGQLIVRNDGTHTLENFNIPSQASNVISLLGLDTSAWEQPGVYTGEEQSTDIYHTAYVAATRETLLSELRDDENNKLNITTGEYYVYQNGIKHTLNLNSTNISIDNFINTLSTYGINAVFDTNGSQSTLKLIGSGDSYLETSSAPNASNVVDKLFNNDKSTLNNYEHYQQTTELVTTTVVASLATMVSDYDTEGSVSAGTLEVYVDGNHSQITVTEYETFGSLLEKFDRIGVTATLDDGVIRLETGNKEFYVDTENSTSNLLTNLGLSYSNDLGGFAASSENVTQTVTITENRTLSVANYADADTQIGLLNITSGSLSIYRNGQKGVVMIDNTEDFDALQTKIHSQFADIDIDFQNGKLRFYSTTEGVDVQVGSSSDSSNISSICGFSQDENGNIISARELYKVNAASKVTTAGIFRNGDVREGTFTIGDAEFTITDDTTIQGLVAQINSSDKSNASAYWDSVDGKLVISSRTTGAAMVNIEAGTSNFTDIIGLTASTWNETTHEMTATRILRDSQEMGQNARFTINGTSFSSSSNVVSSDVSRIQGLTLNLKNATAGEEVTVQVEQDKEAISEVMSEFVDSYNELIENVDKELASTGALSDQNTLKFIKQQIRNLLTNSFGGGTTFMNLSAIGISTSGANAANAGSTSTANVQYLYFDADKFMEGYSRDAEAVKNMLVGSDENPGILLQIDNIVSNALATGSGYFSSAEKSYQQKISDLNEKIKKANASIEAYRARLESKFQSMDLLISQMQNQYNSFLTGGTPSAGVSASSTGAISYF